MHKAVEVKYFHRASISVVKESVDESLLLKGYLWLIRPVTFLRRGFMDYFGLRTLGTGTFVVI